MNVGDIVKVKNSENLTEWARGRIGEIVEVYQDFYVIKSGIYRFAIFKEQVELLAWSVS